MEPGDVEERLLRDHARLRLRLDEIERLASLVLSTDGLHAGLLIGRAEDLLAALAEHMSWEDHHLASALAPDPDGDADLAALLEQEHRSQRCFLEELFAQIRQERTRPKVLAQSLLDFSERLVRDMDHEEALFRSPVPGRDDAVGVDFGGSRAASE